MGSLPEQSQTLLWTSAGLLVGSVVAWRCWRWLGGGSSVQFVSAEQSTMQFSEVVAESRCANAGFMYGGEMLASMDSAGAVCAYRHCGSHILVTASIDSVQFVSFARPLEMLKLRARLNAAFKTSMEVEITLEAENVVDGTTRFCGVGRLVFVRLPRFPALPLSPPPMPRLLIESDDQRRREAEAIARKQENQGERRMIAAATEKEWSDRFEEEWKDASELDKNGIPMGDTQLRMTKMVMPQHANPMGYLFGGQMLAWMELAAYMSATKIAQTHSVCTVGLDRMAFREPSRVGSMLVFYSQVNRVFNKSIEVGVRVETYYGSKSVHCNTGYFTFASIDPKTCLPVSITRHVKPIGTEDKKRFYLAGRRRSRRLGGKKDASN